MCDRPLCGRTHVVDLHAKLVASLHHVLALQRFGARPEHPEVEASMALSHIRELLGLSCQALACVLPEQLVQLEAAEAHATHE